MTKSTDNSKHKEIYLLRPYYPRQVDIEEMYYSALENVVNDFLWTCIIRYFSKPIKTTLTFPELLTSEFENFMRHHIFYIEKLNKKLAMDIYDLTENSIPTSNYARYSRISYLFDDISMRTNRMFKTILNRFLAIIPVGYKQLFNETDNYQFFTDDNSKEDLIKRSHTTLNNFVQSTITQAVSTYLIQNAVIEGYSEYQAENQQDDKVRPTHAHYFDGEKWIRFDSPPPCGNPGDEQNCRCFITQVR